MQKWKFGLVAFLGVVVGHDREYVAVALKRLPSAGGESTRGQGGLFCAFAGDENSGGRPKQQRPQHADDGHIGNVFEDDVHGFSGYLPSVLLMRKVALGIHGGFRSRSQAGWELSSIVSGVWSYCFPYEVQVVGFRQEPAFPAS